MRKLQTWEIALFVWCWQAATLALAVAVGLGLSLIAGHAWVWAWVTLCLDPLRRFEKRSWEQVKAAHR